MGKYIAVRYDPNLIFHLPPGLLTFILSFFHCLVLIDINPFKSNSLCFLFTLIWVHCCSTHVLWCSLVLTSIHPHSACVHLFQFCYLCSLMFYCVLLVFICVLLVSTSFTSVHPRFAYAHWRWLVFVMFLCSIIFLCVHSCSNLCVTLG